MCGAKHDLLAMQSSGKHPNQSPIEKRVIEISLKSLNFSKLGGSSDPPPPPPLCRLWVQKRPIDGSSLFVLNAKTDRIDEHYFICDIFLVLKYSCINMMVDCYCYYFNRAIIFQISE